MCLSLYVQNKLCCGPWCAITGIVSIERSPNINSTWWWWWTVSCFFRRKKMYFRSFIFSVSDKLHFLLWRWIETIKDYGIFGERTKWVCERKKGTEIHLSLAKFAAIEYTHCIIITSRNDLCFAFFVHILHVFFSLTHSLQLNKNIPFWLCTDFRIICFRMQTHGCINGINMMYISASIYREWMREIFMYILYMVHKQ